MHFWRIDEGRESYCVRKRQTVHSWVSHTGVFSHIENVCRITIRASVDALCRDEQGQISRDPRTKRFLTRRESLAKPSKHASNSTFAHL